MNHAKASGPFPADASSSANHSSTRPDAKFEEETGLDVDVGPLIEVFDRIHRRDDRVQYHFVIADYLCTPRGGNLAAADDADDVAWVEPDDLDAYGVNEHALRVIRRGLAMGRSREATPNVPEVPKVPDMPRVLVHSGATVQ